MNKHDQQIAIWTLLGWKKDVKCVDENEEPCLAWRKPGDPSGTGWGESYLPDTDSLDVMHEAEKALRNNQFHFVHYLRELWDVIYPAVKYTGDLGYLGFDFIRATAAQRREALLKTINIWTNEQKPA